MKKSKSFIFLCINILFLIGIVTSLSKFYKYHELTIEYKNSTICGKLDLTSKRVYDNELMYKVVGKGNETWYTDVPNLNLTDAEYCVNKYWYYNDKIIDGYTLETGQDLYVLLLMLCIISCFGVIGNIIYLIID